MSEQPKSVWGSLPALLTALGTFIAAITGVVALFMSSGSSPGTATPTVAATQPAPPDFLPPAGKPPLPPPPKFGPAGGTQP